MTATSLNPTPARSWPRTDIVAVPIEVEMGVEAAEVPAPPPRMDGFVRARYGDRELAGVAMLASNATHGVCSAEHVYPTASSTESSSDSGGPLLVIQYIYNIVTSPVPHVHVSNVLFSWLLFIISIPWSMCGILGVSLVFTEQRHNCLFWYLQHLGSASGNCCRAVGIVYDNGTEKKICAGEDCVICIDVARRKLYMRPNLKRGRGGGS